MRFFALLMLIASCAGPTGTGSTSDAGPSPDAASPVDAGTCSLDVAQGAEFALPDSRKVTLVQKVPVDSRRGQNTWTLRLTDAQAVPISGVEVALRPFMPEHAHATNPPEFLGQDTITPGSYEVGPFNLFMPGLWELTVRVGTDLSVVIVVCLEG